LKRFFIPKNDFLDGMNSLYSTQPAADSIPVPFPSDPCAGNDDVAVNDESNDPYSASAHAIPHHGIGPVTSYDAPSASTSTFSGASGRTYEEIMSFREFLRLQLPSGWFRVSDDLDWGSTLKIKCDPNSSTWRNNGSSITPSP
jgi:hypothetical protein